MKRFFALDPKRKLQIGIRIDRIAVRFGDLARSEKGSIPALRYFFTLFFRKREDWISRMPEPRKKRKSKYPARKGNISDLGHSRRTKAKKVKRTDGRRRYGRKSNYLNIKQKTDGFDAVCFLPDKRCWSHRSPNGVYYVKE